MIQKIDFRHNFCKCGNIKFIRSKRCKECFAKGNRGQLSRKQSAKWNNLKEIKKIIS